MNYSSPPFCFAGTFLCSFRDCVLWTVPFLSLPAPPILVPRMNYTLSPPFLLQHTPLLFRDCVLMDCAPSSYLFLWTSHTSPDSVMTDCTLSFPLLSLAPPYNTTVNPFLRSLPSLVTPLLVLFVCVN